MCAIVVETHTDSNILYGTHGPVATVTNHKNDLSNVLLLVNGFVYICFLSLREPTDPILSNPIAKKSDEHKNGRSPIRLNKHVLRSSTNFE